MKLFKRSLASLVAASTIGTALAVIPALPAHAGTSTCVGQATAYNDDGSVLLVLDQTTTTTSVVTHDAPAVVYAGSAPFAVNVVSASQIDVDSTNKAYNLGGGRWVKGSSDIAVKMSSQAALVPLHLNIGMTALVPNQPTNLTARGAFTFTPPATPQVVTLKTPDQNYVATTEFYAQNQTTIKTRTSPTCDPVGEDTIGNPIKVMSKSTTTATGIPAEMPSNASVSVPVSVAVDAGTVSGKVRLVVDGTDQRALKTLNNGQTTLALDNLTEGNHTVKVEFVPTDANLYEGSFSTERTISVRPPAISTTTTLALNKTTVSASEPVIATATVTAASGTAAGSVVFSADGVDKATVPLSGTTAQTSLSGLAPGSAHDITARFVPTSPLSYASSTSDIKTVVVRAPATASTTVVSVNKNPASTSDVITATANVSAASGTIAGTVQFAVDGVNVGGASAVNGGVATRQLGRISTPGDRVVTAVFTPTNPADFESSSGSVTVTVTAPGTPTTTSLSLSSTAVTSADTVVATVNVSKSGGTPAGSVDMYLDGVKVASGPVISGVATINLPALDEGSRSVRAVFVPADADTDQASQSTVATVEVTAVTSTTTLSLTPDNTSAGLDVVARAEVATSAGTPKGSVDFYVDGVKRASAPVGGNGVASLTLPPLDEGTYAITATFVPTKPAQQKGSTSGAASLVLTAPVQATATTTTATLDEGTITVDDQGVLEATVTAPGATPRGSIEVVVDGQTVSAEVATDGTARLVLPQLGVGTYDLTAKFVPLNAAILTPSQAATLTLTVVRAAVATSTSVVASPAVAAAGETVTLTASVSAGRGTPAGKVAFSVDGGAETLVDLAGLTAEHQLTGLSAGAHAIAARFVPTNRLDFAASDAAGTTVTVLGVAQVATATGIALAPATTFEGDNASASVTVSADSGVATGSVEVRMTDGSSFDETITGSLTDGVATVALPTYMAGTFEVTATYIPTAGTTYAPSTSPSRTFTVAPAPVGGQVTTTTLTLAPSIVDVGETARAIASVMWAGGRAEGSVEFLNNGVQIGNAVALVDGVASVDLPTGTVGSFSITARFVPTDAAIQSASSSDFAVLRVNRAAAVATMTVVKVAPAVVVEGGTPVATATVTAERGAPAGEIVFAVDGVDEAGIALSGTGASLPLPGLAVGEHTVTARFVPTDALDFGGSASAQAIATVLAPVVDKATATAITLSKSSAYTDELVSASVVVTATGATPEGQVVLTAAGATFRAPLVDGKAVISLPALAVGTHSVAASYEPAAGSGFTASTAAAKSVVVTQRPTPGPTAPKATTTTISLGQASGNLGALIPVTVNVAGAQGGVVRVSTGWTTLTAPVQGETATVSLPLKVMGVSNITAVYVPDSDSIESSFATATVEVKKALTAIKLKGRFIKAKRGILVNASVNAIDGLAFCTGKLRLTVKADGRTVSNVTVPLTCSGRQQRMFNPLPAAKKYTVVATYKGSKTTLKSSATRVVKGR